MDLQITKKQKLLIDSEADETLFGGAAGGGKSYGQLVDAMLYAFQYPNSKQIIFRRTFPELQKSIVRTAYMIFPRDKASYNEQKKSWKFMNGSIIDFGALQYEKDIYDYQSAEYDVIRWDELTHFTERMYIYMLSRCRGANNYPKRIKSSTNPGGIGHVWVKKRFIDESVPNEITTRLMTNEDGQPLIDLETGLQRTYTTKFIPSLVQDNKFLMEGDPNYINRLNAMSEKDRRALLYGDWEMFDGVYFSEFRRSIHVIEPFEIPNHWKRYISLDYGLDMFAVVFVAVDDKNNHFVYNEIHKDGLLVSQAAQMLKSYMRKDTYQFVYAPPDLWNKQNQSGKSTAEIFLEQGIALTRSNNSRVTGWWHVKEHIKVFKTKNEHTGEVYETSRMKMFNNCYKLIEYLPAIQTDEKNPNDCANDPHYLTHICDALRGYCIMRNSKTETVNDAYVAMNFEHEKSNYNDYGGEIVVV